MTRRGPLLTERDPEVLCWIGEQYGATVEQICFVLGRLAEKETKRAGVVSSGTAEKRIRKWEAMGLVVREKIFINRPAWVHLAKKGLGILACDYRYVRPQISTLEHIRAVNDVRLHIERRMGDHLAVWRSERLLRYEWNRDEAKANWHVPDAEVVNDRGGVMAIEVELTIKAEKRLNKILRELARRYGYIHYYTTDQTYAHLVARIGRLGEAERERFKVLKLEDIRLAT